MKSNYLIIGVVTLVLLAGGYWYMSSQSGNDQPLTSDLTVNPAQAKFQALVGELTSISFDTKIFSDARFTSLTDIATPVTPESSGRIDPFAPVAGAGI